MCSVWPSCPELSGYTGNTQSLYCTKISGITKSPAVLSLSGVKQKFSKTSASFLGAVQSPEISPGLLFHYCVKCTHYVNKRGTHLQL